MSGPAKKKPSNLLANWFESAQATARLMCGVPDYDTYVRHTRLNHPDKEVMSYEAFFRERLDNKYARGASRCC